MGHFNYYRGEDGYALYEVIEACTRGGVAVYVTTGGTHYVVNRLGYAKCATSAEAEILAEKLAARE